MVASTNLIISCNFSCLPLKVNPKPKSLRKTHITFLLFSNTSTRKSLNISDSAKPLHIYNNNKKGVLQTCYSTLNSDKKSPDDQVLEKDDTGGGKEGGRDWTTSILLFVFWGGIIYYVFNLTPDQTPSRDMYFLEKLLNLKGDDGFRMNSVLVSLWYIMGLWPLVYSMLLLPTGSSSKTKIPVWPFLILSCFGGAYALLPYFILWTPPPPPVEENELGRWPLNFLESKLTSGISLAAGLAIILNAALNGGDWMEFYQYFRESKFIHITCLDFTLLSAFGPFWVYNDMTARKW
uniref:Cardiolipin synthase N-terminal domain-containing protein n=1 Tax=Salix viminalis TaxID=40686 RepID=A0A6N2N9K0_SALVM